MTVLRCTARLPKRLRQPARPPEPPEPGNPLGEWYADIDFFDREPFVLLLNAATGAGLVLPGRAAALRAMHAHAAEQLALIFRRYGIDPVRGAAAAELEAWSSFPVLAKTRDRSLLGSMNSFKASAWQQFAHFGPDLPEAARQQWEGFFRHPSLARPGRVYSIDDWHKPLDLVHARLAAFEGNTRVPTRIS